jgi:N-formylglutamate deformylase
MHETFDFTGGSTPLLVSLPHGGTYIPDTIANRMTAVALETPDTDWHVGLLYDFASSFGASVISATHSRYVIDLNRNPVGAPLYSGADNTELVPLTTFDYSPIYKEGCQPGETEITDRAALYWKPYHEQINGELSAIKARHGYAILFDGHSIKSNVGRFYDGQIPDLNLGTANGNSAAPELALIAMGVLKQSNYPVVLDDRFTGGHITRSNGAPENGIHAIQLELTWRNYMEENPPYRYLTKQADNLKTVLKELLQALIDWRPPAP